MISAGNTAFLLIAVTFVFLMTPGLAFFYGGLSRRKNVLNTMMSSIFIIGLASLMWVMIGYSLSFSGDNGGYTAGCGSERNRRRSRRVF